MALNLQHQTAAEFAARFWTRLRAAYQADDKYTYHRMVWWIWNQIQLGNLTSDQVRLSYNAFFGTSLNTAQWNSKVTSNFLPVKDRWLAMKAQGEV